MGSFLDLAGRRDVAGRVEQLGNRGRFGGLQSIEPVAVGIGVDFFRRGDNRIIDREHDAGDRRVDVGGSLDRFDDGAGLARRERATHCGRSEDNEVAQRRRRTGAGTRGLQRGGGASVVWNPYP